MAVAASLFAIALASSALAAPGSGERTAPAPGTGAKASSESLTYDGFSGFNCSQAGFFTLATGHLDIAGPVSVAGRTTLDGAPYDTYAFDLGTGPDTFQTTFERTFAPPPPGSATYTFVFRSDVYQGARFVGSSITTIACANGAMSAANVWRPLAEPIPAGPPAAWIALALLLAASGVARLARRGA